MRCFLYAIFDDFGLHFESQNGFNKWIPLDYFSIFSPRCDPAHVITTKMRPKAPQERAKTRQERPKSGQKRPKSAPRRHKSAPRAP